MPEFYAAEMVIDWMAAAMTHGGSHKMTSRGFPDLSMWLNANFANLRLHRNTRVFVINLLLDEFDYKYNDAEGKFYAPS